MRLWHKDLIPYLPRQQLLGQWREVCAIARNIEKNGTPNHVLVNKVLEYEYDHFLTYADRIGYEMEKRGYRPNVERLKCGNKRFDYVDDIFPNWHNERYLRQCLSNLQEKADCGAIPAEEWKRITDRWTEWR